MQNGTRLNKIFLNMKEKALMLIMRLFYCVPIEFL